MRTLLPATLATLLLLNVSPAWSQAPASPFQAELVDAEFTSRNVRPAS